MAIQGVKVDVCDIKDAIKKAGGKITHAAKILKCVPFTIYRKLKEFPDLQKTLEEARDFADEEGTDLAEDKIKEKIQNGDVTCIIFYLKTKGAKRGWGQADNFKQANDNEYARTVLRGYAKMEEEREVLEKEVKRLTEIVNGPDKAPQERIQAGQSL